MSGTYNYENSDFNSSLCKCNLGTNCHVRNLLDSNKIQCTYLMTTTLANGRRTRTHQTLCPYKISGRCCKNVDLSLILCRNCTKDLSDEQQERF
jgi:hypothetical protein